MAANNEAPEPAATLAQAGVAELPSDWSVTTVGDLLSGDRGISVGVMYPGSHDPAGIPLLKVADLAGSVINPHPSFRITPKKHHEYRRTAFEGGEILLTLVGGVGQCAVVPPSMAGWNAARAIAVIRLREPEEASYVRACLLSRPLQHLMEIWCNTTVQATLNLRDIKQLPLPWPPVHQRRQIADTLGSLDDKIELNRRMNQTLEAMARAIFKSWFIDFDPVRAKVDGNPPPGLDPATAALFPDAFQDSPLGPIPQGWEVKPIGDTVRVVGGGTPSTKEPRYWDGGTHPFCTPRDMSKLTSPVLLDTERHLTDAGVEKVSSGLLPTGTVVLSSRAPIGYLAITERPVTINQGIIAMICDQALPNHYALHWARENMHVIEANANGSTFAEISKRNFRPIHAIVPPPPLLYAFAAHVTGLHQKIVSNLRENITLRTTRDALLPQLLSGRHRYFDLACTAGEAT
ncbi:MAG: restriction endonuclease subunit S [Pirellulales bacterium]